MAIPPAAEGFIDRVNKNPEWGYTIRGIIDDTKERGSEYKGVKVIGCIEDLDYILEQNSLDEIAVTLSLSEYEKLRHIVALCEKSGVHTKFIPDYGNIIPTIPYMEDLQGLPVIHIRRVPLNDPMNAMVKRAVDIVGAIVGSGTFLPDHADRGSALKADISGIRSFFVRNESAFTIGRLKCINSVP